MKNCKGKPVVWVVLTRLQPLSVSGEYQGATAGPRAPKKKAAKQKRHCDLPSQERQEYYKSYLAHL